MDEQVLRVVDMERIYLLVQQPGGGTLAAAGGGNGGNRLSSGDTLAPDSGGPEVDVIVQQALVVMFRVLRRAVLQSAPPSLDDSPLASVPFGRPTVNQVCSA